MFYPRTLCSLQVSKCTRMSLLPPLIQLWCSPPPCTCWLCRAPPCTQAWFLTPAEAKARVLVSSHVLTWHVQMLQLSWVVSLCVRCWPLYIQTGSSYVLYSVGNAVVYSYLRYWGHHAGRQEDHAELQELILLLRNNLLHSESSSLDNSQTHQACRKQIINRYLTYYWKCAFCIHSF